MPPLPGPHVLDVDPLLALLVDETCRHDQCRAFCCDLSVAERLGVDRRQVQRWKSEGLTVPVADRLAARLDLHPALVWGSLAWERANDRHERSLRRLRARRRAVAA